MDWKKMYQSKLFTEDELCDMQHMTTPQQAKRNRSELDRIKDRRYRLKKNLKGRQ